MKYLILIALVISCSSIPDKPLEQPTTPPTPSVSQPSGVEHDGIERTIPVSPEYPIAGVKKVFTVKIVDTNYTSVQKDKLKKAEELIAKVFNSDKFKSRIVGHTFNQQMAFDSNNNLSNQQIYDKLFAGAELLLPAVNYQMDLTVTMYYKKFTSVVGYTTPQSMIVNTNSKFHDAFDPCDVAGNLTHEWTHKMGFDHKSAESYDSVPYAVGYLAEELCKEALNGTL